MIFNNQMHTGISVLDHIVISISPNWTDYSMRYFEYQVNVKMSHISVYWSLILDTFIVTATWKFYEPGTPFTIMD